MFPKTTEYALRAMGHLATLPAGASAVSADLAEAAHIPRHYLSKLMRRLVVAELVTSQRGHGGGFSLARPPEAITFAEVLAAVDFPGDADLCVFGWGACNADAPCPLHPAWRALQASFLEWAQGTHLGDVRDGWAQVQARLPG